jgi:hypothetical protein
VPLPPAANAVKPGGEIGGIIIGGDGYAYVSYATCWRRPSEDYAHITVVRVDSQGASNSLDIYEGSIWVNDVFLPMDLQMITNADTGILISWGYIPMEAHRTGGMAVVTGTSVSLINGVQTVDQWAGTHPVLQAQNGLFIGTAWAYDSSVPDMVAFDAAGNTRWSVRGYGPKIATADGGVIAQAFDPDSGGLTEPAFTGPAVKFDENGNATGQVDLPTYSWTGNAYQVGSVDQVAAEALNVALSLWAFLGGNNSGNGTAIDQQLYPPLSHCSSPPSCVGHHEAINNALYDLVARLSDQQLSKTAQEQVFDKLGNDSWGRPLTTNAFVKYLTSLRPGFYNGLRSSYCRAALTPPDSEALCNLRWLRGQFTSVADYFRSNPTAGAVTGTPNMSLFIYFRPESIGYDNYGKNLGNEATLFHEALHGMTGLLDSETYIQGAPQLLERLGYTRFDPSCKVTKYIQDHVLKLSLSPTELDKTDVWPCP